MPLFHGLSAFPITPADEAGRVKLVDLSRLLDQLVDADVDSIGLLGSTGGYAYLSPEERRRAVNAAVLQVDGRVPIIVGTGALRTDQAIELAKDAKKAGADGLLLAPVSYTPLTDEEVFQHFVAVANATDLPLCIYNNPSTTNFSFSRELIQRLSEIDTICAVKMPLPAAEDVAANLSQLRAILPADFSVGYSGDWGCASALLADADCWFSVVGGILPQATMKLAMAARSGDKADTQRINASFEPLWKLFQEFGSFRIVYAIANLLELTEAKPHLPILPLQAADVDRVKQALDTLRTEQTD